ncbi:MAG TPA: histidine phosphatase family protein [Syntrophorhabdaceae bacterium]|nr:histidine phosphatase family protein [Syntrophorhabdaceae bacterium]
MLHVLLIRHAMTDMVDVGLPGRKPGIHLNDSGRREADILADRLSVFPIRAFFSSPLERAVETVGPACGRFGMEPRISDLLNEVDFGEWTGRNFESLKGDEVWWRFNHVRSTVRIPCGETMLEVQKRAVLQMENIASEFTSGIAAVVSHGDVIRTTLAYYAGFPIDMLTRITIDTISISMIAIGEGRPRIICVNCVHDISQLLD